MMATYTGQLAAGVLRIANGHEIPFQAGVPVEIPDGTDLSPDVWIVDAPIKVTIKAEKTPNEE